MSSPQPMTPSGKPNLGLKHASFKPSRLASSAAASHPTSSSPVQPGPEADALKNINSQESISNNPVKTNTGGLGTPRRVASASRLPSQRASPLPASTFLPPKNTVASVPSVDPNFEFAAPQFCDFDKSSQIAMDDLNPWTDSWFDDKHSSPVSGTVARPSALLKQLQSDSDPEFDDAPTPKANRQPVKRILPKQSSSSIHTTIAPAPVRSKTAAPSRPRASRSTLRPATAAPAAPLTNATTAPKRPTTAPTARIMALSKPKTHAISAKSANTREIGRMFARLSLKQAHPRTFARDPAAQARLLSGTAAWKARLASAAEEASMNSALHRMVGKADVGLEPGLARGLTKRPNPVWAAAAHRGPTVPKEFNFASGRKDRIMRAKSPGIKKRKPIMKKQPELTVPKPFNLHETGHSRNYVSSAEHRQTDGSPFVALAVKVKKFETDTPERFRPVIKAVAAAQASGVPRLTKPHSPMLLTKIRIKQQNVKTSEEQLLEEIKSHPPFKAQPVNKKVLKQPSLGVPAPHKHTPTIPQSPHFSKPRIPPPPPPKPPTPPKVIKAYPVPRPVKPFEPVLDHRFIVPAEVKLPGEEVRARKLREFEEERRRMEDEEERARRFVARPVPDLEAVDPLPSVPSKPPTQTDPFYLHTASARGGSAFARSGAELSAGELLAAVVKFTAQPVPCADHPFIPRRSAKPPTVPDPILLHTDLRVEERSRFEEARREREVAEEDARERARMEQEELEREEVRCLRAAQVFVAQPVKQFPGLTVHASQRRLTEPESPMLKEKRERMARLRGGIVSGAERHAPVRFGVVAVAAEGEGGNVAEVEAQDGEQLDDEDEEFAAEGQFEAGGQEQLGGIGDDSVLHEAGRKEWPALQEWVDSDGVSGSDIF